MWEQPKLNPEAKHPFNLMVVCTGNICRSAMADMILRDRLAEKIRAGQVRVASSGVSAEETGNGLDPRARQILQREGYRGLEHRAHRITDEEIRHSDLILAMTSSHAAELERRARALAVPTEKIRLFREFDPAAARIAAEVAAGQSSPRKLDVPDPWYGDIEDFEETLAVVERTVDAISANLN